MIIFFSELKKNYKIVVGKVEIRWTEMKVCSLLG